MMKMLPLLSLLLSPSLGQAYTVQNEGESTKKTHMVLRIRDGGQREEVRQAADHPPMTVVEDLQRENTALREKLAAAQKKKERLREQFARQEEARQVIAHALREENAELEASVAAALAKQKHLKEQVARQTSN